MTSQRFVNLQRRMHREIEDSVRKQNNLDRADPEALRRRRAIKQNYRTSLEPSYKQYRHLTQDSDRFWYDGINWEHSMRTAKDVIEWLHHYYKFYNIRHDA